VDREELEGPSEVVRARMRSQRRSGTKPEIALRKALHAKGLRYRVAYPVPGLPRRSIDVAFPGKRVAVFVDGCYWHRCPEHHIPAKNNSAWWQTKLQGNVKRDRSTDHQLASQDWLVLRFWEHEDMREVADSVAEAVAAREGLSRNPPP